MALPPSLIRRKSLTLYPVKAAPAATAPAPTPAPTTPKPKASVPQSKISHAGEHKDKAGHRYCLDESGKRVACAPGQEDQPAPDAGAAPDEPQGTGAPKTQLNTPANGGAKPTTLQPEGGDTEKDLSDPRFAQEWDQIVANELDQIERSNTADYQYTPEEAKAEQDWHKQVLDWSQQNPKRKLGAQDLPTVARFIGGLLNPIVSAGSHLYDLARATAAIASGDADWINALAEEFVPLTDDEKAARAAAQVTGAAFGQQAAPVVKQMAKGWKDRAKQQHASGKYGDWAPPKQSMRETGEIKKKMDWTKNKEVEEKVEAHDVDAYKDHWLNQFKAKAKKAGVDLTNAAVMDAATDLIDEHTGGTHEDHDAHGKVISGLEKLLDRYAPPDDPNQKAKGGKAGAKGKPAASPEFKAAYEKAKQLTTDQLHNWINNSGSLMLKDHTKMSPEDLAMWDAAFDNPETTDRVGEPPDYDLRHPPVPGKPGLNPTKIGVNPNTYTPEHKATLKAMAPREKEVLKARGKIKKQIGANGKKLEEAVRNLAATMKKRGGFDPAKMSPDEQALWEMASSNPGVSSLVPDAPDADKRQQQAIADNQRRNAIQKKKAANLTAKLQAMSPEERAAYHAQQKAKNPEKKARQDKKQKGWWRNDRRQEERQVKSDLKDGKIDKAEGQRRVDEIRKRFAQKFQDAGYDPAESLKPANPNTPSIDASALQPEAGGQTPDQAQTGSGDAIAPNPAPAASPGAAPATLPKKQFVAGSNLTADQLPKNANGRISYQDFINIPEVKQELDQQGEWDASTGKAEGPSYALGKVMQRAIDSGKQVIMHADGGRKKVPMVSFEDGMGVDAQGQRWGLVGDDFEVTDQGGTAKGPAPAAPSAGTQAQPAAKPAPKIDPSIPFDAIAQRVKDAGAKGKPPGWGDEDWVAEMETVAEDIKSGNQIAAIRALRRLGVGDDDPQMVQLKASLGKRVTPYQPMLGPTKLRATKALPTGQVGKTVKPKQTLYTWTGLTSRGGLNVQEQFASAGEAVTIVSIYPNGMWRVRNAAGVESPQAPGLFQGYGKKGVPLFMPDEANTGQDQPVREETCPACNAVNPKRLFENICWKCKYRWKSLPTTDELLHNHAIARILRELMGKKSFNRYLFTELIREFRVLINKLQAYGVQVPYLNDTQIAQIIQTVAGNVDKLQSKAMSWLSETSGGVLVKPPARAVLVSRTARIKEIRARIKGSYFGECPRDEHGHCLPEGSAGAQQQDKPEPPQLPPSAITAKPRRMCVPNTDFNQTELARQAREAGLQARSVSWDDHPIWQIEGPPKAVSRFIEDRGGPVPCNEYNGPTTMAQYSAKFPAKALDYLVKDQQGASYFGECPRDEGGHCKASGEAGAVKTEDKPKPKASKLKKSKLRPKQAAKVSNKIRATRGKMMAARRVGKGKKARLVMASGKPVPSWITPAMVPPALKNVKVAVDPKAEVLVTGINKLNGKPYTGYSAAFAMKTAAAKFARVKEMMDKDQAIAAQNQQNRQNPALVDNADCAWLMDVQATRPGSDADTKGVQKYFGKPMTPNMIVDLGGGKAAIKIGNEQVRIKDPKTAAVLLERKASGKGLENTDYWLNSYGATTLEGRHIVQQPDGVHLQFTGKEGVHHDHRIADPGLAKMLTDRKAKAGHTGKLFNTDYEHVSKYVAGLDGGKFTPKDLRTKRANLLALQHIAKTPAPKTPEAYKAAVMDVAQKVSGVLGNKPAQALESYISPAAFAAWKVGANAD